MSNKKETDSVNGKERTFKEQIQHLREQTNRSGKAKLTTAQRCRRLNNIYDGTLHALEAAVMEGNIAQGIGAAIHLLERSRLEMIELDTSTRHSENTNTSNHTMAYEYEMPSTDDEIVEA